MAEEKLCPTTNSCTSILTEFNECFLSIETWSAKPSLDICFEGRKKRPQDKGRKKRKKGKWDPQTFY